MALLRFMFVFFGVTSMTCMSIATTITLKTNVPVPSSKFFFAASISSASKHICSGFILNKRWIITSAHCLHQYTITSIALFVRYGSHNRCHSEIIRNDVQKIVIHPRFGVKWLLNNVALIKVTSDIQFIPTVVQAATLPRRETAENSCADAVGWEKFNESVGSYFLRKFLIENSIILILFGCFQSYRISQTRLKC